MHRYASQVGTPEHLQNFERNLGQLEWFWLFSIAVAGKRAEPMAKKVDQFCFTYPNLLPFGVIGKLRRFGVLTDILERLRFGQYSRIGGAYLYSTQHFNKLRTITVEELEQCPGVGPKTSRFFVMNTRPDQRYAALDTHVLHFLRDQGHDAPQSTPPAGPSYTKFENAFLDIADERGLPPAVLDFHVWAAYREGRRI